MALIDESGKERPVARVNNGSNTPVYEVVVKYRGISDLSVPELVAGSIATLELPDSAREFVRSEKRTQSAGLRAFFIEIEASHTEEKVLGEELNPCQGRRQAVFACTCAGQLYRPRLPCDHRRA
jgi:hypothetical protein